MANKNYIGLALPYNYFFHFLSELNCLNKVHGEGSGRFNSSTKWMTDHEVQKSGMLMRYVIW